MATSSNVEPTYCSLPFLATKKVEAFGRLVLFDTMSHG
jgi:hypothetical protein